MRIAFQPVREIRPCQPRPPTSIPSSSNTCSTGSAKPFRRSGRIRSGRRLAPRRRTAVAAGAATGRPVPGHARRTDRQRALRHHGRVPACRAAGPSPGARRPVARQRRHAVAHHAGHAANVTPATSCRVGGHRRAIPAEIRRFAPSGDRRPAPADARRVAAGTINDLALHPPGRGSAAGVRCAVRDQRQAGCRPAP